MKSLLVLTILSASFSAYAAPKRLCPAELTEVLTCTSQRSIPLYPYVAVCADQNGENILVLDRGAAKSPDILKVLASEANHVITFKATEEDTDNLAFSYKKDSAGQKSNGLLTFDFWGSEVADKYTCK